MKFLLLLSAPLIWLGGCIPSQPMSPGQMDSAWRLSGDPAGDATPKHLSTGEKRLPSTWTIRQEPDTAKAQAQTRRALMALQNGEAGDSIELAISPQQTADLDALLGEAQKVLHKLRTISSPKSPLTPLLWSRDVATALVATESLLRAITPPPENSDPAAPSAAGWTLGPGLSLLANYLETRSAGAALEGMTRQEIAQLRQVLIQIILRTTFAAAGRHEPPALRQELAQRMAQAQRPQELQETLREILQEALRKAPRVPTDSALYRATDAVLTWTPRLIAVVRQFLQQWRDVEYVRLELVEASGQSLAILTSQVKPGREVKLANLFVMQPVLAFRGKTRLIVVPEDPITGQTLVLAENAPSGGVQVRFEGLGYAMARLWAVPLADGTIREVRIASPEPQLDRKWLQVEIFMIANGPGDPRRLIVFDDLRHQQARREAFDMHTLTRSHRLRIRYLTPSRHYDYLHTTTARP